MVAGVVRRTFAIIAVGIALVAVPVIVIVGIQVVGHFLAIPEKDDILELGKRFYEAQNQGDPERAYQFMSSEYRNHHSVDEFAEGFYTSFIWGIGNETDVRVWGVWARVFTGWISGGFWAGYEYGLVKESGDWYFTGELKHYRAP